MDCEGSETAILDGMEITPRAVIVECHPTLDAPPEEVRPLLHECGYEIVDRFEAENGNITLTAVLDGADD